MTDRPTFEENGYTIYADSLTIADPGKFEGEPRYVLHFWDIYLDGGADEDDGQVLEFYVSLEDRAQFPELGQQSTVKLVETEQGFVIEV